MTGPRPGVRAFGGYQPGLDGIRALGMLAMLGYHGELAHTQGAIFALSQFFTVSGFLITAILLDEQSRSGTLDVPRFWARRFRRLAPAALAGLALALAFGATAATRGQVDRLPGHVLGALTYVVNWVFVSQDQSYADLFADPSPVQHYWSLAIEEQLYFVLPLTIVVVLRLRPSIRVLGVVFALGAVASTAWTWWLFESGVGVDRLYYGTDTRIGEMLVGATFAVFMHQVGSGWLEAKRRWIVPSGVVAFALSMWIWVNVSITDPRTWHGGFLIHSLLTVLVVGAVLVPRSPLNRLYSFGPIAAFGRLTYGVYIYHWPIFLWLDGEATGLDGLALFGVRCVATVALSMVSLRWLERPIRSGASLGLGRLGRALSVPVAGVVLLAVALVVGQRDAPDPLETIRVDGDSGVPVASDGDGLDLAIVYSAEMEDVVEEMLRRAETDPELRIPVTEEFGCDAVTGVGESAECVNWAESWSELVEAHDPDAVLLIADRWEGIDLASAAAQSELSPESAARVLLGNGLERLEANRATVVWSAFGGGLAEAIARSGRPLVLAFGDLEVTDDLLTRVQGGRFPARHDVEQSEYVDRAATALLEDMLLYQRGDRTDRLRVMVVGDSQARSLGYGLERWGEETEHAWVWNRATPGCGLVAPLDSSPDDECAVSLQLLGSDTRRFAPDVVVVLSSFWDLADDTVGEWQTVNAAGREPTDSLLFRSYSSVIDAIEVVDTHVVWMSPPCLGGGSELAPGIDPGGLEPDLQVIRESLLPALTVAHPDIDVYPLDQVLCPGGEPLETTPEDDVVRIDGFHFSVEGALWFADTHASEILALPEDNG